MTLQPVKQTMVIHVLPNIPRNWGNKKTKFGQLIEHVMRNVFIEKSYTKCDRATITRYFSEKSTLSTSLD